MAEDSALACIPDTLVSEDWTIWLEKVLPPPQTVDEVKSMAGTGGNSGRMVRVHFKDGRSLVVKTTVATRSDISLSLGLTREATFYNKMAPILAEAGVRTPKMYYSNCSLTTGIKVMVMEDLCAGVQAGLFFGLGTPLNWEKDLAALTAPLPSVTQKDITFRAFEMAARLHGQYWGKEELLSADSKWLRASDWYRGLGKEAWEQSTSLVARHWENRNKEAFHFDPLIEEIMDASLKKRNYEQYLKEIHSRPWTLVHGDWHPANMMALPKGESFELVICDWEVVGIGSGPQDLGQFVISHVAPEAMPELVDEAFKHYVSVFRETNAVPTVTEDVERSLHREMVFGGLERWVWLFAFLCSIFSPPMLQYFHDQLLAYAKLFGVNGSNIGMVRP